MTIPLNSQKRPEPAGTVVSSLEDFMQAEIAAGGDSDAAQS